MQELDITTEPLSVVETKVYQLNGLGMQIKEIADKLQSSYETVKSHMKSIKAKLKLQKDKEVTAHFWCNLAAINMDEVKKQVIAACLMLIFLLYIPFDHLQMRESRTYNNRNNITIVARRNDITA